MCTKFALKGFKLDSIDLCLLWITDVHIFKIKSKIEF